MYGSCWYWSFCCCWDVFVVVLFVTSSSSIVKRPIIQRVSEDMQNAVQSKRRNRIKNTWMWMMLVCLLVQFAYMRSFASHLTMNFYCVSCVMMRSRYLHIFHQFLIQLLDWLDENFSVCCLNLQFLNFVSHLESRLSGSTFENNLPQDSDLQNFVLFWEKCSRT